MQNLEWRNGALRPRRSGRAFLARVLAAYVAGGSSEEFAEQEMRQMQCPYCQRHMPVDEDGNHQVLGVKIPCEAT